MYRDQDVRQLVADLERVPAAVWRLRRDWNDHHIGHAASDDNDGRWSRLRRRFSIFNPLPAPKVLVANEQARPRL
jgi:hypothetical protein